MCDLDADSWVKELYMLVRAGGPASISLTISQLLRILKGSIGQRNAVIDKVRGYGGDI